MRIGATCAAVTLLAAGSHALLPGVPLSLRAAMRSVASSPSPRASAAGTALRAVEEDTAVATADTSAAAGLAASLIDATKDLPPRQKAPDALPARLAKGAVSAIEAVPKTVALIDTAQKAATAMLDETCEMDPLTGQPADDVCTSPRSKRAAALELAGYIIKATTFGLFSFGGSSAADSALLAEGDVLEAGWEKRGSGSSVRRNAEVWKYAAKCGLKVLAGRKLEKKDGTTPEEIVASRTATAEFIRDGLLRLGPTFVKLGQVVSTRTDLFPDEYINVLKSLQDDVPAFSGNKAKAIVEAELGKPISAVFSKFDIEPLAAASLGQVHRATLKDGRDVAVKVQRSGLKDLFDTDLKNLKKLAELLDKFDPKTDGADRCWAEIYDESARLLYLEIDYLNEGKNSVRFANDFKDVPYVRVPKVYWDYSTEKVLCMEFVESFKLTDIAKVEAMGLDKEKLAKQAADSFLQQIVKTGYFHCDPHPGNLACAADGSGDLVYYDYGMMDELKPRVREGFKEFCFAIFDGGPYVSDAKIAESAKMLVNAVEKMGVLAKGADRLAVEKLARYFIKTFKDSQIGKKGKGIKETVGPDLQTLTEGASFRFPSTFTFIFRAFASVDGIGKGLDKDFDLPKFAQPFVEEFIDEDKYGEGGGSSLSKNLNIFGKATGLNAADVNTAITSPRKIAYLEKTVRNMEEGTLKIRVRSLENEKALERVQLGQNAQSSMLMALLALNAGLAVTARLPTLALYGLSAVFAGQAAVGNLGVKKFDKKAALYESSRFESTGTLDAEQ